MSRTTWSARTLAASALTAVAASAAPAGLLPTNVTITPEDGKFRWTYAIVLPTDMKLQSGNFFTIYDFAGHLPGGETGPDGWTVTATKTGPTPDRLRPGDDPNVTNLTYTYTGPTIPSGQLGLGNFWAYSEYGNQQEDFFTARTNRTSDGLVDSNITDTVVPVASPNSPPPPPPPPPPPGPTVPEPGTLLLAGLGLPLIGAARLRRKKAEG